MEEDQIITQDKVTGIYYKGKIIDYPFQMNIHQLDQSEFVDCLYDLYFKEERDSYDNFLDMLHGKFGRSIVEKFLRPYNEKLYATDLTTLDTNAMGRFFPYADFSGIIRNMREGKNSSYNDHFLYLKQGTQYFVDKLRAELDPSKIRINTQVSRIDTVEKVVTLTTGETIGYDNLINTTPLNFFLEITGDAFPTNIIKEMSYNKVLVLNLGFSKSSKIIQKNTGSTSPTRVSTSTE